MVMLLAASGRLTMVSLNAGGDVLAVIHHRSGDNGYRAGAGRLHARRRYKRRNHQAQNKPGAQQQWGKANAIHGGHFRGKLRTAQYLPEIRCGIRKPTRVLCRC